jgi:DNA-binding transcriptional LysR family regulator
MVFDFVAETPQSEQEMCVIRRMQLLRAFLAVADAGGIRQASEKLHTSQPALTRAIQNLEEDIGVALFERSSTGMVLTRFGEILRHHAQLIEMTSNQAIQEIHELTSGGTGVLRVGAGAAWGLSILPKAIAQLQRVLPLVTLQHYDWVNERTLPMLAEGKLDAVVGGLPHLSQRDTGILYEPLMDVEQLIFAHKDHPLQGKMCALDSLSDFKWVWFREATLGRNLLSEQLAETDLAIPPSSIDTTSIYFGIQLLADSPLYLMLLPSTLSKLAATHGLVPLQLEKSIGTYPAGLMYRESSRRLKAFAAFREIIHAEVATLV